MALRAVDSEALTIDATVGGVGFTVAKLTSAVIRAFCVVEDAQIRINTKNVPTAGGTEGSPSFDPGTSFYVTGGADLESFRAIRAGSASGTLQVIYEGTK